MLFSPSGRKGRRSPFLFVSNSLEPLEQRRMLSAEYRSIDGTGNNLAHPDWGSTNEALLRLASTAYTDGRSAPSGATRPSARAISNAIVAHDPDEEVLNARQLAAFAYLWGQFIDHDLDLTGGATPAEPFNIVVPTGDPYFDPLGTGAHVIALSRSQFAPGTGINSPRQQTNSITAFLDASMVYGSDSVRALALRTLVGGRMLTSAGRMLPFNTFGLPNANDSHLFPDDQLYLAGDVRANENIELTAIHTLFVREHNRLAAQIEQQHPGWNDEQIYQQARRLVIAEIQVITYKEFLPALLGPGAIPAYTGYKSNVNAGIANEFSTAAFRLGHSMLANDVEFLDNDGEDVRDELELADAFFNPSVIGETGVDPILKYLASSNSEEIDNQVVDGLRNFLFGPPGSGGFDLASLNIQRGRDHGLPDYNTLRAAMGLGRVTSFAQISSDPTVQQALQSTYGTVNNIDPWVGGLAEDHVSGSSLGPTFQRVLINQFTRVRDGDRFWYQRDLSRTELQLVKNTRLSDVIKRNTDITNIQDNVFVFSVKINGRVWNDVDRDGQQDAGELGLAGRVVDLVDDEGLVALSTTTDSNGNYDFGNVQIGHFTVRPELPARWRSTTDATQPVHVTRGDMLFADVDFGQRLGLQLGGHGTSSVARSGMMTMTALTVSPRDGCPSDTAMEDLLA